MGSDGSDLRPSILLERALEQVMEVLARYHVTNPRVFGSVARGDDTEESDVDLLVTTPPGYDIFDKVMLTEALEEVLGVQVDVVPDDAHGPVAARAATEAVPLWLAASTRRPEVTARPIEGGRRAAKPLH